MFASLRHHRPWTFSYSNLWWFTARKIRVGCIKVDLEFALVDAQLTPIARRFDAGYGFNLELGNVGSGQAFEYALCSPSHYVALHDIVLEDGEIVVGGGPPNLTHDLRGTISYFPKGIEVWGRSVTAKRSNSYVAVYFDTARLHDEIDFRYRAQAPAPFVYMRNARLQTSLTALRDEVLTGSIDALYCESVCMSLAINVLRCEPNLARGGLSCRQLTATFDFIAANIGQDMSLDELASAATLSRFHFARAFKSSTGQSPAEFVRARRVDYATKLLNETSWTIETIATQAGFSGGNQFRRAFESVNGCTPNEFRRRLGRENNPDGTVP